MMRLTKGANAPVSLMMPKKATEKMNITPVCADERILGADGKVDLAKFRPITYDPIHHSYRTLGESVGQAFSDGLKLK
ncbi:MAG: hypothetical protein IKC04_07645 [Oscillospiraceae bacterium]|nr:hypothetical protein [Oscillospiraceae bacterium]